jgi:hypothetical protein
MTCFHIFFVLDVLITTSQSAEVTAIESDSWLQAGARLEKRRQVQHGS